MKTFAVIAAFAAAARAALTVAIGNTDFTLVAGQQYPITWFGAEGPVTINLKFGASGDLSTISTITASQASSDGAGTFVWSVPNSLPVNGPYAFEITDTVGDVNYSAQFPISGVVVAPINNADDETTAVATSSATTVATVTATSTKVETTSAATITSTSEVIVTSSSVVVSTSAHHNTTLTTSAASKTATTTTTQQPTIVPPPGSSAARFASPLAMFAVSAAAVFYLL